MSLMSFKLDWQALTDALTGVVVLSFFVERALAVVVESRWFVNSKADEMGFLKELLSIGLSFAVVKLLAFDALAIAFRPDHVTVQGMFISALIISGGSKGSIKFFHDVLGMKSTAVIEKDQLREAATNTALARVATHSAEAEPPGKK